MDVKTRVKKYIQDSRNQTVTLLQKLVQERSISGNEAPAQEIVINHLNHLGLKVDVWDPDIDEMKSSPFFITQRDSFSNSPNVFGVLE